MKSKKSMCINILYLCLLVYTTAPVLSGSVRHVGYRRRTHGSPKTCKTENHFSFDLCKFPTDGEPIEIAHSETGNQLDLVEFLIVTDDDMIKNISRTIRGLGRNVRCKKQLKKLKKKTLEDVMKIQSSANVNINSNVTKTYLKIATLTFLMKHLDSELSPAAKECCLPNLSEVYLPLRKRILQKWYSIVDSDDHIEISQCGVCVHIDYDRSVRCDDIRDVIYILLQHVRGVLKDSKPVLKSIIRGRNRT